MILKGKFPWYSPEKVMSDDARSVFNTLPALSDLPHIPTAVMELQQLIQEEDVSAEKLAKVSKRDPLIASSILNVANQRKSSSDKPIESIAHAISYIGMKGLSDILITASVSSFPFRTTVFSQDLFWQESFLIGRISEYLSQTYNKEIITDEAYLAGCLCNVGKVVYAICFPELTDKIASDIKNVKILGSWESCEKINNSHSYTILGEIAATFWGMPEYVMTVARHHLKIYNNTGNEKPNIVNICAFANQLSHWLLLQPTRIDKDLLAKLGNIFNLDEKGIEKVVEDIWKLKDCPETAVAS